MLLGFTHVFGGKGKKKTTRIFGPRNAVCSRE